MQAQEMTRRERERIRQRQEILETALKLFSEKGYHHVSMHEIASTAEFAIGTLYKFFSNKEDLYKALIMEQADRFHSALTTAIESSQDPVEQLRRYVRTKGEVFRSNASVIRLYFAETRGASFNIMAGVDQDIRRRREDFLMKLAAIFAHGIAMRRFSPITEPYILAVSLDSLCNGFLFLWLESPDRFPYPENPDDILNILFKGLLREQPD